MRCTRLDAARLAAGRRVPEPDRAVATCGEHYAVADNEGRCGNLLLRRLLVAAGDDKRLADIALPRDFERLRVERDKPRVARTKVDASAVQKRLRRRGEVEWILAALERLAGPRVDYVELLSACGVDFSVRRLRRRNVTAT